MVSLLLVVLSTDVVKGHPEPGKVERKEAPQGVNTTVLRRKEHGYSARTEFHVCIAKLANTNCSVFQSFWAE